MRPLLIPLAISMTVLLSQAQAHAGRVISFDILLDNQIVLTAGKLDNGSPSPEAVWKDLASLSLHNPAKRFVLNNAETERLNAFEQSLEHRARDNRLVLQGKIRIFCRYAGDATTDTLTLIRKDAKSPWTIDPAEVERLAATRTIDPARRTRDQIDRQSREKSAGRP